MPLDDVIPFHFDTEELRGFQRDGEPWFVASDACRMLDLADTSKALSRLDDDERGTTTIRTLGGAQQMLIVSESGLYALIFTSRKPEARRFRKWLTAEVIPAIRRTGRYADSGPDVPPAGDTIPDMARQDVANWLSMVREARLLRGPATAARMWRKSPLPALDDDEVLETTGGTDPVSAFILACCEVTGSPDDRVRTGALWDAFRNWTDAGAAEPLTQRSFHNRLAAMAGTWKHPVTGRRFGRHKASETYCVGLALVVGA